MPASAYVPANGRALPKNLRGHGASVRHMRLFLFFIACGIVACSQPKPLVRAPSAEVTATSPAIERGAEATEPEPEAEPVANAPHESAPRPPDQLGALEPMPFDAHPSEETVARWRAEVPQKRTVSAALRKQALIAIEAESNGDWVSVIVEIEVRENASAAQVAAARKRVLRIARRAGAQGLSEIESQPTVAFSVHHRVLDALLRSGLVRSVSPNTPTMLGNCSIAC